MESNPNLNSNKKPNGEEGVSGGFIPLRERKESATAAAVAGRKRSRASLSMEEKGMSSPSMEEKMMPSPSLSMEKGGKESGN